METEYTQPQGAPAQEAKWSTSLTTVTTLSKTLAAIVFIVLPFFGFWLGMQYGAVMYTESGSVIAGDEIENVVSKVRDIPVLQEEPPKANGTEETPLTPNETTAEGEIKDCFPYGGTIETVLNTSGWFSFEGVGFAAKYPANLVRFDTVGDPYVNGDVDFTISSLKDRHVADVRIYRLREETFVAGYKNISSILYELYSNTWWNKDYRWDAHTLVRCNPNPIGMTEGGLNIYSNGDGDVGVFFRNYFVVMRDVPPSDTYEPLVVQITVRGDANGPGFESFADFEVIIENIVRTLEIRPTSRG